MGKSKVLTSASVNSGASVQIDGDNVEIVKTQTSEKYLGRKLCLANYHATELANRLCAGWAAFERYKDVFRSRSYPFRAKAKLFEAVVSPAVLYGSASWTMTKAMETELVTTKRKMLRIMSPLKRGSEEPWVEYIKRSTSKVENQMEKLGYESWVACSRRSKWVWLLDRPIGGGQIVY